MKEENLLTKKKITLSTLKSFLKRNKNDLHLKIHSRFNGMIDGLEHFKDDFEPAEETEYNTYYTLGIKGLYVIPGRSYFNVFRDKNYIGITVWNSCGKQTIVTKK